METNLTKSDIEIENLLLSLSRTKFRGSFHLNNKMKDYVRENIEKNRVLNAEEID